MARKNYSSPEQAQEVILDAAEEVRAWLTQILSITLVQERA